jgi:MFS family permease
MEDPDARVTALTYRYDLLRAIPQGIIETASTTFLLLIAVKALDADPTAKALIAAAGNVGLLLSLWLVPAVEQSGRPTMQVAAWLMLCGALAMLCVAAVPAIPLLVLAALIAIGATNAIIPLLTSIYQDNYPPRARGRLVSRAFVVRVLSAAAFAELGGRLLSEDIARFRWLLAGFGLAFGAAAYCLVRIPSQALNHATHRTAGHSALGATVLGAFASLRYVRVDRTLRWMLASWMLMGFANLMMVPLRVEYLANPRYGLALDPQQVALYTVLIPGLVRLALSPLWGRLFDRMDFFAMRIVLNAGFALSILAFFTGASTAGLALGAALFGAAAAGGELVWNLWATKFAPPAQVAEYMSVHTFFTGIRGIAAPFVAFQLTQHLPIGQIALICAGLIGLASLILVPESRREANC